MLMLITYAYKAKQIPLNFIGLDRAIFQKAAAVASIYQKSLENGPTTHTVSELKLRRLFSEVS